MLRTRCGVASIISRVARIVIGISCEHLPTGRPILTRRIVAAIAARLNGGRSHFDRRTTIGRPSRPARSDAPLAEAPAPARRLVRPAARDPVHPAARRGRGHAVLRPDHLDRGRPLRWCSTSCACSASPASTTATSPTARTRRAGGSSSCSRGSAARRCRRGRCGGPGTTATTTSTPTRRTTRTRRSCKTVWWAHVGWVISGRFRRRRPEMKDFDEVPRTAAARPFFTGCRASCSRCCAT